MDTVELINNSGSATAISQFEKVGNNNTKIHFKFSKEIHNSKDGRSYMGLHLPHDKDGNPLEWNLKEGTVKGYADFTTDANGNAAYKEVTITVFEEAIDQEVRYKDDGLVITNAHEDQHDLDTKSIQAAKDNQEGKANKRDPEMTANAITNIVKQEIKESKESKQNIQIIE